MTLVNKVYLGDAVYAAFKGYSVILTTENGFEILNTIFLEPYMLAKLDRFRESLRPPLVGPEEATDVAPQ